MTATEFQAFSHKIPQEPGIYKYYDENGQLLYVGKAKNLKKRISSYFLKNQPSWKTRELVNRIRNIEFTIVHSEQDAFFLENALIKELQPRFNIDLKDDKTYPFIVIKKEDFPRVFLTRRKIPDGSEYLGPFTSVGKVRELIEFIRNNIPLRTCKLNLSETNIRKKKFKVCLEYHLGNCKGPCEGLQNSEDYEQSLIQVRNLLKGNLQPVIRQFREAMNQHASSLEFEQAESLRKKITYLEEYNAKSVIVTNKDIDADIFALVREGDQAYVSYLMVCSGTVIQTHTIPLQPHLEETEEEIMQFAIAHIREKLQSPSKELVVPFALHYPEEGIKVVVPKGGDRKKLLDLAQLNANYFRNEMQLKKILKGSDQNEKDPQKILYQLQEDLQLPVVPNHIECFDNSNFQGSFPVSAMVCFKNGLPSKGDYRHFNIKSVTGINDFASMKEVVYRRYKRLLEEKQDLPQLVIIDGGKGQLSAAMESIEALGLTGSMTLVGLAKNEEELFFTGDTESLKLDLNSESLKLVRRIRDEVHRFGITFHRKKRSAGTFRNELEDIKGIGKNTATMLLSKFKSVRKIRELPLEEIATVTGMAKARLIKDHFDNKKATPESTGE
jgi:excinuclease ABC subunit C